MARFKIRCSAIGDIMSQPKKVKDRQAGQISEAAKSYCDAWIKKQLYKKRHETVSKYTTKGILVEDSSIEFVSQMLEIPFLKKNTEQFENEYLTGEPDVLPEISPHCDLIIDTKNSWSFDSFPLLENELPEKNYYYQGQGYMALTGRKRYIVAYILSDAPEHLIEAEAWKKCRAYGLSELDGEIYQEYEHNMTYSNLPDKLRIKLFKFNRDEKVIAEIYQQVEKCRKYIRERIKQLPKDKQGNIITNKNNEYGK